MKVANHGLTNGIDSGPQDSIQAANIGRVDLEDDSMVGVTIYTRKLEDAMCRICLEPDDGSLIEPCSCKGSVRYVHENCLKQWIQTSHGSRLRQLEDGEASITCQMCNTQISYVVENDFRWKEAPQMDCRTQCSSISIKIALLLAMIAAAFFLQYYGYRVYVEGIGTPTMAVSLCMVVLMEVASVTMLGLTSWLVVYLVRQHLMELVTNITAVAGLRAVDNKMNNEVGQQEFSGTVFTVPTRSNPVALITIV